TSLLLALFLPSAFLWFNPLSKLERKPRWCRLEGLGSRSSVGQTSHNDLRRMTNPSASNMLKMVSCVFSKDYCQSAFSYLKIDFKIGPIFLKYSNLFILIEIAGCGENLFMSSRPESWSDAIQFLYNEVKDFKYGIGNTRANANTFHYTQLVWATSHQLGCALAHCPHQKLPYYYVCQYCPASNILLAFCFILANPCMYEDKYTNCADLVKFHGCNLKLTRENCQATCKCPSEIK
uniref:ShKT domain-containing protein n=1 Tax=Castor canadensis TaxID=51338 RepID=A0A8C0W992_CASCN